MKTILLASITCALVGCGGAIDTSLLDGGGDAGNGNDGTTGNDSGTGVDGGSKCDSLYAQLQAELPTATACCATCDSLQCTQQVDGLCCPITVNNADSPAVKQYEDTLKAFTEAKCAVECPAIACSAKPSGVCNGNTQSGTCQP